MNSLVLYVGTQAITYIHSKGSSSSTSTIAHTAHMDIFQHLVVDLDTEGEGGGHYLLSLSLEWRVSGEPSSLGLFSAWEVEV